MSIATTPSFKSFPIFNENFSTFHCRKDQANILKCLLLKSIAYPSTYVWEKVGIRTIHHIGEALEILGKEKEKENLDLFADQLLPKIRKIFQRTLSLLFPNDKEKNRLTIEQWKEEKDVVEKLNKIAESLSVKEEKKIFKELSRFCDLFFVFREQKVDASALLVAQKICEVTNNYLPVLWSEGKVVEACQSILTYNIWLFKEGSPYSSLLGECKVILTQERAVPKLLRHMQKVWSSAETNRKRTHSQDIPFNEERVFTLFYKEFLTAAGILLYGDPLGDSLKTRAVKATDHLGDYQYEKRKREWEKGFAPVEYRTDSELVRNFVENRREIDDTELEKTPITSDFIEFFSSQIEQFTEGRLGNYISLFFLISFELLQPNGFSYKDLLQNYDSLSRSFHAHKEKFKKNWQKKLATYKKRKDRNRIVSSTLKKAVDIEKVHAEKNSPPFLLRTLLQLHQEVLGGLHLLLDTTEERNFTESCERKESVEEFFANLSYFTMQAILRWPPVKNTSLASTAVQTPSNEPEESPKKLQPKIDEPQEDENRFESLHEEAMEELELQRKQQETEETKDLSNENSDEENKSSTENAPQPSQEKQKKDDFISISIPRKLTKLRNMLTFLRGEGFTPVGQTGGHRFFQNEEGDKVTVPVHAKHGIAVGTASSIINTALRSKKEGNE